MFQRVQEVVRRVSEVFSESYIGTYLVLWKSCDTPNRYRLVDFAGSGTEPTTLCVRTISSDPKYSKASDGAVFELYILYSDSTMTIPTGTANLGPFAQNFVSQLEEHAGDYHAGTERTERVAAAYKVYEEKLEAHTAARDAAKAATLEKDVARDGLLEALASTSRFIKGNDEVTNSSLERLGLPARSSHRTPVRVPTEFPVGAIMNTDVLEHTLTIFNPEKRTRRGKPTGVTACEIWVAVAPTTPKEDSAYRMIALATRETQQITFNANEGGEMAHYRLRWVNTKGEVGPWSPVASGTIPAV